MAGAKSVFESFLIQIRHQFPRNGTVVLRRGEDIRTRVRQDDVAKAYGVYVIRAKDSGEVLNIGKAGTVKLDGTFTRQRLPGRLTNRQGGTSRSRFFAEQIEILGLSGLHFEWFVTFDGKRQLLPAKVEADLLQAYWEDHGCLPIWNKEF